MYFLFPIGVDVPMRRMAWMNWALMALTVIMFPLGLDGDGLSSLGESLVAGGAHWHGHVGHVLVHADIFHLAGNMLFLWVFGNAVCAKVGNFAYARLCFGLGTAGSLLTMLVDPSPGIGASGAINSIVGMFLVWYALNTIRFFCFYWILFTMDSGDFEISSHWVVLVWLLFDIWGAVSGASSIGYWAHIVGLALGVVAGLALLKLRLVTMEEHERSILDLWTERRAASRPKPKPRPLSRPMDSPGARTTDNRGVAAGAASRSSPVRPPSSTSRASYDDDPIPLADMPENRPSAP